MTACVGELTKEPIDLHLDCLRAAVGGCDRVKKWLAPNIGNNGETSSINSVISNIDPDILSSSSGNLSSSSLLLSA
jgi:hypothetical protein